MENHKDLNVFLYRVEQKLRAIRSTHGGVEVTRRRTDFVLAGEEFTLRPTRDGVVESEDAGIRFWLGVNELRMFFITYVNGTAEDSKETFKFSFGGACKVGWEFSHEPLEIDVLARCSIWGTCMAAEPLVIHDESGPVISSAGRFWATDIAMMAQSMLRTAERKNVFCLDLAPEPL